MAPPSSTIHLPNGHNVTVTPVFGGLSFKAVEFSGSHSAFPPGWTVVLHTEDDHGQGDRHTHIFREPSLQNDHLFISSISSPPSTDFKPVVSQTRQIAMMLWATLWWYFHQPEPTLQVTTEHSSKTPLAGRPKQEWRININREGIMKGRYLLPKLERMGLVTNGDSSVGLDSDDRTADSWSHVYITRRHFWMLDARIFLFSLSPTINSPYPPGSPATSRPSSPSRAGLLREGPVASSQSPNFASHQGTWPTTDPFRSTSFLPTYFPPAPSSYVWTNNIRHPHRPKAPRQGEVFYTRYVPSLGETLSFRVANLGRKSILTHSSPLQPSARSIDDTTLPMRGSSPAGRSGMSDVEYLHKWMNNERVAAAWGEDGPIEDQQQFLERSLQTRHSFPVIGCFDSKPFGYFEIYWVKEDQLGRHLGSSIGDWDRGFHCLVGEENFRGSHRVKVWLSSIVHYCFLADMRTEAVMLEPRVDNDKLRRYCEQVGFYKEREVALPHKQSNVMKITREGWEAPCL